MKNPFTVVWLGYVDKRIESLVKVMDWKGDIPVSHLIRQVPLSMAGAECLLQVA
jgi:hypothetical protein